ncbi:ogr/Delta-like zinc finger family protein [Azohydromonas lata]|uniref:Ogr/Delta-like zinc finger family protein n=1 Tax=Azohydromonas lata TaxID=45677 RepID=A0ABU5IEN5_9BURK|nr:ogr/Delta-like zinc finger family protein [Azohydromonas lata]MDZ5456980.1 ogr/Delta-like zinc finger family protein [Azohydromonas lata]
MTEIATTTHQRGGRMRLGFFCPHCGCRSTGRNNRYLSPLLMELTFVCNNLQCGHIYVAQIEAVRSLSPSSIPRTDIQLPLSQHVRRGALNAVLSNSPVAATADPVDDVPAASRTGDLFEGLAYG